MTNSGIRVVHHYKASKGESNTDSKLFDSWGVLVDSLFYPSISRKQRNNLGNLNKTKLIKRIPERFLERLVQIPDVQKYILRYLHISGWYVIKDPIVKNKIFLSIGTIDSNYDNVVLEIPLELLKAYE